MVKRRRDGRLVPVTAELTASLASLAELCAANLATVAAAAAKLSNLRQKQIPHSGPAVAAHLQGWAWSSRSWPACCNAARNCSAGQWRSGRLCCLVS